MSGEKRGAPEEGLAGLVWVGAGELARRAAARASAGAWGAVMMLAAGALTVGALAAMVCSVMLSLLPLLVVLMTSALEGGLSKEAEQARALALIGAGVGAWALGWLINMASGWRRDRARGEARAGERWTAARERAWVEDMDGLMGGAMGALKAARAAPWRMGPLGRLAGWALITPPALAALCVGVAPWMAISALDGLWIKRVAPELQKRREAAQRRAGEKALGGDVASASALGRARALWGAPKAWARAKALEVAKVGAGTARASEAQRAALEKEIRAQAAPSKPAKRL